MKSSSRAIYGFAFAVALLFAGSAAYYRFFLDTAYLATPVPIVGEVGSTHTHASLLVMDRDKPVSFCMQKYMLASQVVHFEDANCLVVHKHATGVTLDTFFKTINVVLTQKCLTIPDMQPLCEDGENTLRVVVNGAEVLISELPYYELQNNDHILLNYGPEEGALLRYKYNQVPNIPEGISN